MAEVRKAFRDVLQQLVEGRSPWPLFLYGAPGSGKTRGCLALLDYVRESYYCTLDQVVVEVLQKRDLLTWSMMSAYGLTVVDELATRAKASEVEYSTLKRLADLREDKPAIWISNLHPEDLVKVYDDRIASRILCGTVWHLEDEDRRFKARKRKS